MFSLNWLADVLRDAGLNVQEVDGWKARGQGDVATTLGVLMHHTAGPGPEHGNYPSLETIIKGRADLSGPLAHLGLGRDGTYFVIAAGHANHAGLGSYKDVPQNAGNSHLVGIEAENTGTGEEPWPDVQIDAYVRGVAAILKHAGRSPDYAIAHREWAPTRKVDPKGIDMADFRARVTAAMEGEAPGGADRQSADGSTNAG